MRNILLIIDMLNDFVHEEGALNFEQARKIVPFIRTRLNHYRMARYKLKGVAQYNVIYLCDQHMENDEEFERFPKHALVHTWGREIVDELKMDIDEKIVYKNKFDGFYDTTLDMMLKQLIPLARDGEVEVVGVCTSICVMDTVTGLCNRGFKVVIPAEGVADFDDDAHKFALNRMEKLYGAEITPLHTKKV